MGTGRNDWGQFDNGVARGNNNVSQAKMCVHLEASDCKEMVRDGCTFLIVGANAKQ